MELLTSSQFKQRFTALVLSARDWPRRPQDHHVLLISAVVGLDPERSYIEAEINQHLQRWCLHFGQNLPIDHVSLRRYLIDAGYLQRDSAGQTYRRAHGPLSQPFDPEIETLDLEDLIFQAQQEREARRREHTGGAGSR